MRVESSVPPVPQPLQSEYLMRKHPCKVCCSLFFLMGAWSVVWMLALFGVILDG